jgi:biopolymer transport protein ExbD
MKKIILAIVLLTSTAIAFAGSNNNQTNLAAEKNISVSIRSQIQFPEFLKEKEGEHLAAIFFKVTKNGTIKVQSIQCDDQELKTNLLNQSENFKISTIGLDTRDTYKVVVKFETL